jgi:hypothetical protein
MELRRATQTAALGRAGRLETLQPPYHLFRREIEHAILADAVPVWGPHPEGM